ncbi:phytanoyl-CoA dioxygenase family protein [Phytoactinopolyspora halotolerans]|uniref:Phytanoyl-CoA dioxygenase family protein n=1 Tax=Phytoactinopolyspora halotolerans TaxID=1981512 RepID=A0A6L9S4I3_9ACTN|nr:phytanoyl-CoA dioxygenase family protein [Phytoactinopolyspora halotolerans]NED99431.1 phytanoyl-CoA dioxygenase family protein [Phytoactinopolyspora halotolerans]
MPKLTAEEVDAFGKNGYLIYRRQLFSEAKFDELSAIFSEHLADKGDKLSDELDTPHFRDPRLLDFLLADEVLDIVECLIGPDIALWSSHFISKDPYTGRATPWHEDSAYWEGRLSAYDRIVTLWLSLDGSDRENGCMRVIPGTHDNGFSEYTPVDKSVNTFHAEITDIDESRAVDFELEPGQCSLHDGRIIHGARANTSARRRTGYTMRYFPSSVYVHPEKNPGWRIWLARGVDKAGNVYVNA